MAKILKVSVLFLGVLSLGACTLDQKSWVNPNRVQLKEDTFFQTIPVDEFDRDVVAGIARVYERSGDGDVSLSVAYDPQVPSFGAIEAGVVASTLVDLFRKNGVHRLRSGVLPSPENGGMVLVSFNTYIVDAPKDCRTMPGVGAQDNLGDDENYALGCTIETLFSQQLARPKDLRGGVQVPVSSDGRRVANSVESYRDGLPNEAFEDGESATGQ